jgi:hypothetical protein
MRVLVAFLGFLSFSFSLSANLAFIDADDFTNGTDISYVFPFVFMYSTGGAAGLDGKVYACADPLASTGGNVFANNLSTPGQWLNKNSGGYALHVDFMTPTDYVAIDFIGDGGLDYGTMDIYNSNGVLITSVISPFMLDSGQVYTAEIQRTTPDIAFIVAGGMGVLGSTIHLDNLVFGIPEPATCSLLSFGFLLLKPGKKKRTHSAG